MAEGCSGYGGLTGTNSKFIKLIAADGQEFIVLREHALTSGTIRAMLAGNNHWREDEVVALPFTEIQSHVLQKVCQYFAYKFRYTNSSEELPVFDIPDEMALDLAMAADFLDC